MLLARLLHAVGACHATDRQAGQELISAAIGGDTSKAVQLLAAGADLEERNKVGMGNADLMLWWLT
jgi:hypothetical protein